MSKIDIAKWKTFAQETNMFDEKRNSPWQHLLSGGGSVKAIEMWLNLFTSSVYKRPDFLMLYSFKKKPTGEK